MHVWSRSVCGAALAVLITLTTAAPAVAQDGYGVGVGVKVGPTFPDFSSDALDIDNRTGWHGGLFIGGNRDDVVGFQVEVNWLRKRAELAPLGPEFRVDYIQVPLFLRLNAGTESRAGINFYGMAGPAFSFKVADEISGVTIDDDFEGTDVGLVLAAGVEITRIIVEGRYEWGFRRINDQFNDADKIKTRAFTILLGIRFN